MTAAARKMGVIMGTAAYMSPEQAVGKAADKRSDLWSFGVVLFEMLTGRALFTGETVSHVLAEVLKTDPDWTRLPSGTPALIQRFMRRCLERNPKQRLPDAAMVRLEIDEADAAPEASAVAVTTPVAQPALWQRPASTAAMLLGTAVVSALAVWTLTRLAPAPPEPITRTSIVLPQTHVRTNTGRRGIAISPTGTHVAYVANRQLYLRALDQLEAQPLTGTEDSVAMSPFFSPDGQWIGFFAGEEDTLKKVAVTGGAAVTLAEYSDASFGASWGADDTIVFVARAGIFRVAGAGGTPELLVSVDPPVFTRQPQMLPGGEALLYTRCDDCSRSGWDTAEIVVERLATGERTVVVERGSDARYLATGHLVYALGATLLAVPFDVDRLTVTGGPVPLVEGVSRAGAGAANADIARTGALVYLPGGFVAERFLPERWSGSTARDAKRWCPRRHMPTSIRASPPMGREWRSVPRMASRTFGSGTSRARR